MTYNTILKLGRVSNLPTVWTNALAGAVLAGQTDAGTISLVALALTAFYIGGMWLNDAFDAEIDAREKADRPIPMGEVTAPTVFAVGFALLALGIVIAFSLGRGAGLAGIGLAITVILYDWLHKRTVLSPVLMGATRFMCYMLPAATVGVIGGPVVLAATGLFAYVVGLTYAAKQEAYDRIGSVWPLAVLAFPVLLGLVLAQPVPLALIPWALFVVVVLAALRLLFRRNRGDVPKAVVTMIAGMSLYDAVLIASVGQMGLAIVAMLGFALTLLLQRIVSGT